MSGWHLALLMASADPGPAGLTPYSTPAVPPDVVCGPMRRLELADLPLTLETTYADVVEKWGEGQAEGPDGEVRSYYLTCDARLWLSFRPVGDARLARAIILRGDFIPAVRVILNDLEVTKRRNCRGLRRDGRETAERISRKWGPPDNQIASGIVRWTYRMADGGSAEVVPLTHRELLVACRRGKRGM